MSHHAVRVGRGPAQPRTTARCDSVGPLARPSAVPRRPNPKPADDVVTFVDLLAPTPIFASCVDDYLIGAQLRTRDGRVIGTVKAWVAYPAVLGAPWGVAVVQRGSARSTSYLVDLSGALFDGVDVAVPHDARTVLAAPRLKPANRDLTLSQRHQVYAHYRGSRPGAIAS